MVRALPSLVIVALLAAPAAAQPNAAVFPDGSAVPLYAVRDPQTPSIGAVGFRHQGGVLTAVAPRRAVWSQRVGDGEVFGGFDFNADGWPDLAIARSRDSGERHGVVPVRLTWLDFLDGRTGTLYAQVTPPTADRRWDFRTPADRDPAKVYTTTQFDTLSVLFGEGTPALALLPHYAHEGLFVTHRRGADPFVRHRFVFPATPAFDALYRGRVLPNALHGRSGYLPDSHVANGLFVATPAGPRLVAFTSARVVQYAPGPLGPAQLVADRPFLSGGRRDLSGRNYGVVTRDPRAPHVVLVGGTSAFSLYSDMLAGKQQHDPWGQIERHVAVYNFQTNQVDDRFVSYAYDHGTAGKYEGRVAVPDSPLIEAGPGQPSRVGFNVYRQGRWHFHVTRPGSTADARVYRDVFVWDVRDLDGDGRQEIVASPTPEVPGSYFAKWETRTFAWDERSQALVPLETYPGVIPHLVPAFRRPTLSSSMGYLYPVLTAAQDGELKLVGMDAAKRVRLVSY